MTAAERLRIVTCIACGAMERPATCEACEEERVELVLAAALDEARELAVAAEARAAALQDVLPAANVGDDPRAAFLAVRERARGWLAADVGPSTGALEDVEPITVWRCRVCGGVDAPQPCLGVCVRPVIEWVAAGAFAAERARLEAAEARAARLEAVLRRLAALHPRDGRWAENLEALCAAAARAAAS